MPKILATAWSLTILLRPIYVIKRNSVLLTLLFLASPTLAERRVTTKHSNTLDPPDHLPKIPREIVVPKPWKKLIDPTEKEFWREGNHLPDAGFIEWATNPTVENAKLYLIRMNAKRDRLHLMQKQQEQANKELIEKGIIANDYDFLSNHFATKTSPDAAKAKLDPKAGNIWFYFHPGCIHCKRQAKILAGNSNVTPMQVAGDDLHNFSGLKPSSWAEKEDLKRYVPDGKVPVLIVYNEKTNKLATLKGVKTIPAINKAAANLRSNKGAKK